MEMNTQYIAQYILAEGGEVMAFHTGPTTWNGLPMIVNQISDPSFNADTSN